VKQTWNGERKILREYDQASEMNARTLLLDISRVTFLLRPAMIAFCLVGSLSAQRVPVDLDSQWKELAEAIIFQAAGDESAYSLDIEDCPEVSAQCIVLTNNEEIGRKLGGRKLGQPQFSRLTEAELC